jgi:hypothetical protein
VKITAQAESIELAFSGSSAVVVAEGLRTWSAADGTVLISRGPRFKAASAVLGRLRSVPDRLGVVREAAETHAVILAKNCRTEEMELTQRWYADDSNVLHAELEFIVPPACAGLEKLGVELEHPGETPLFRMELENASALSEKGFDGRIIGLFLPLSPVPAGIHRMNIAFIPDF